MSDVRIERVEPCEHGNSGTHTMCRHPESFHRHDNCPDPILCPRGSRKVLDAFPPEAVEAVKESIYDQNLAAEIVLPNGASEGFVGLTELECELIAEAALAAAWEALLRSDSEQTLRISWEALYGEDS